MQKKENVIWIVTDQQRAETLSINGSTNSNTPNIDLLARTGVNLTSAVSGFPLCCPFRGSMLTGIYPHKCVPGHEYPLNPNQKTIADVLNENDYDTFYLGKWHLDGAKEGSCGRLGTYIVPRDRRGGFKYWFGYENNNAQYDCHLHGHKYEEEISGFRLAGYETDALTDIFIEYLEEKVKNTEPFFGILSVQPPHDPYVAPAKYLEKHSPASIKFRENVPDIKQIRNVAAKEMVGYYAMVENIDYNIGRIVETLNRTGLMEDTHIIYFSDHGDMHGSHGQFRKTTPYQEAVNVPFIISGEKRGAHAVDRNVGNLEDILMNHVDIAPTTLGLCNIGVPDWMEGTDYSGVRLLEKERKDYPVSAYLQSVIPTHHGDSINKAWRGIITADGYKYVTFEGMDWLMFDLKNDPYEQVNMVHNDKYQVLRMRLMGELKDWIEKTGDSFELPQ